MTTADSSAIIAERNNLGFGDRAIQLGGRVLDFMEQHPAVPVLTVALMVFGSMGRAAIKAGWTPEQVAALAESFPVRATMPALAL